MQGKDLRRKGIEREARPSGETRPFASGRTTFAIPRFWSQRQMASSHCVSSSQLVNTKHVQIPSSSTLNRISTTAYALDRLVGRGSRSSSSSESSSEKSSSSSSMSAMPANISRALREKNIGKVSQQAERTRGQGEEGREDVLGHDLVPEDLSDVERVVGVREEKSERSGLDVVLEEEGR